jgi:CTP synthase
VQVIPHVTEIIKDFIYAGAEDADVLITEIGGTTGDIESPPYLEAIRQISLEKGQGNCLFIHVTLIPYLKFSGEHKSKPTQHSVKELRAMGIDPHIIIARADEPIGNNIKEKISLFCNVKQDCVIENTTVSSLYEVPLMLHENGLDRVACRELSLDTPEADLAEWRQMTEKINSRKKTITIAIVGKYTKLHDAYLSIIESLNHAGFEVGARVDIRWIDSVELKDVETELKGIDGMIVPGGFGDRGIDGKIAACRYARENNIPYLGICLGMQIAVIEFARHVCGLDGAHSGEFDPFSPHLVIDIMPEQKGMVGSGGTMRLGAYPCAIKKGTLMQRLYGADEISERHRHRFEFNNEYREIFTEKGFVICGESPNRILVEAIELPEHPFFIGVQFHPEFKSRPNRPHPLFLGLAKAAKQRKETINEN